MGALNVQINADQQLIPLFQQRQIIVTDIGIDGMQLSTIEDLIRFLGCA
ncbi:MAG: hypothetical protein ACU83N_11405 [Gammaproteobacteria bacterium]